MEIAYAILVVVGLVVLETVASIDNAIIKANILSTLTVDAHHWFLTGGIIIAAFGTHGILP
ncbi:MAG: DUF475 domain-containing protein [Methanocalculaceae archaeon]|jgi:hypothetical protein|nr:DUF475 domain-containing protein [Methanocalculaceae archaeon]